MPPEWDSERFLSATDSPALCSIRLTPASVQRPGKWPVVVWLHPYAYAYGWSARSPWNPSVGASAAEQRPSFASLTQHGFAVFAFDQIGFGSRLREANRFYERYPKWSLL